MKFGVTIQQEEPSKVLDRLGIAYNPKPSGELWTTCPWCGSDGRKDGSASVNGNHGAFRCLHGKCNRKASMYEFRQQAKDKALPMGASVQQAQKKVYGVPRQLSKQVTDHVIFTGWLNERGLTLDTAKRFGVCLTAYVPAIVDPAKPAGTQKVAIAFPHIENGVEVFRQYRLRDSFPDKPKPPWKTFVSEANCRPVLFGRDVCSMDEPYVIITEGQCDAMAAFQIGFQNAVSVPNGSSNMDWIAESYDWLMHFQDVLIATDSDGPGEKAAEEIAQRLGRDRCRRLVLEPHKDLNDALRAGWTRDDLWKAIKEAKEYKPAKLNSLADYIDEAIDYQVSGATIGDPSPWDMLTERTQGFRPTEQTLWNGDDGIGKSTALLQLLCWHAAMKIPCCIGSFEMRPKNYINWMSHQLCGGKWTPEFAKKRLAEIAPYVWCINHIGPVMPDELMEYYTYAAKRFGVRQFITDSLFMVGDAEYDHEKQANFAKMIKVFVETNEVHHHLVTHPRKDESDKKTGKDKSSIAGSKVLTKIHQNIILISEDENGVYFEINKCREAPGPKRQRVYMDFDKVRRIFIQRETQPTPETTGKKKRGDY